jgi:hypothetical protein
VSIKKIIKKIDTNFIGGLSFWADVTEAHSLMSNEVEARAS